MVPMKSKMLEPATSMVASAIRETVPAMKLIPRRFLMTGSPPASLELSTNAFGIIIREVLVISTSPRVPAMLSLLTCTVPVPNTLALFWTTTTPSLIVVPPE